MAAIEDSIRRTGTASKRRNKTVDEAGESTLEPTSKGTLETTPPPTYASVIACEPTSKGTLGAAHVPSSDHASDNALDLASKGTLGAAPVPASDNASDDDLASALSNAHEPTMSEHLTATLSSAEAIQSRSVSQYRSLSERVDSIEQRWHASDASTSQLQDIDAHMRYVLKTFERTDAKIAEVELHSSHMEAVLIELRGASATTDQANILVRTHVQDTVELLVQPRLLEIATAQSAATSDTLKRVNLLEADMVTELNTIKSRLLEVEPRLYLPTPDDELMDARVSAIEDRLRLDVGDQGLNLSAKLSITRQVFELHQALDNLSARVLSLEANQSRPSPLSGLASAGTVIVSRQARHLACFIFAARATVGTFLAGVVFAVLCTFWLLQPRLLHAPSGLGSLNMIHGHVNLPNLLKHGTILKAAADTRGSSLFDGGATHIVHEDDKGAVPGSWRPDVAGLRLGDDTFIPAYGSVLKDFIPPADVGGPDIRRRVLIAPAVASRVWSGTQEVDMYGSTFVDSPSKGKYLQLEDGRILKLRLASNGLRMLDLRVRPTDAMINNLVAIRPAAPPSSAALCRITGVGKRHIPIAPIEFLRLWHCILGHLSSRRLLATIRHTLVLANVPALTPDVVKAYEGEHCDVCNAFLQKRASAPAQAPVASGIRAATEPPPSVGRALRPLYRILLDVFGPVPWASAQFGYRFVLGLICEATMMRWIFGLKTHTEVDIESCINLFLASMRLLRPDLSIDIIRSDGAPENRSHRWYAFLEGLGILHEQSIAYDSHQMGAIENTWNLVPSAGAMLAVSDLGKTHWYTALRYAVLLSNIVQSNVTGAAEKMTSAFERFYSTKPCGDHLNVYGAPIRYHVKLHTMGRDDKFDEHALPGFYVGPSPENPEEKYVWTGTRHISVGGSFVIDESRFLKPIHLSTEYFASWPVPTPDSTVPSIQLPPRPMAKTAQVLKEPLANETILEFRYANADFTAWDWYLGKVVSWRRRADNGIEHEIKWLDDRWVQNDWINLASPVRIWRVPASSPPSAPPPGPPPPAAPPVVPIAAQLPPPAAPSVVPPAARATRSSTRTAALLRTRAVQPRLLMVDTDAKSGAFTSSLQHKGWLVDSITNASDVTVQSELRDGIIGGTYDHVALFLPLEVTSDNARKMVSIVAALALVAHKSGVLFTIIGNGSDTAKFIWSLKPMVILKQTTCVLDALFPLCSFGVHTSLCMMIWTTSELVQSKFADLGCTHSPHASSDTLPRLPEAVSTALAQAIASTAITDVQPEFTTKIDGMHPIFAARYDKVATGLHRRSELTDEPALRALLATAADLADMPTCLFHQDDVPSELVPTTATLLTASSDENDMHDISLLDVPDDDDGPAIDAVLNLAKGKKFSIDRKEVVYYTDSGVTHALEPRGIKEALTSLQRDQWLLAIDKEMDNLRAHDAFHYVPVKEVLAQGKKIMRMTWVFKIKTLDTGALDKFKARFCVVGTNQVKGQDYFESFASGARGTSVKSVVIMTVVEGWIDFHFDLNGAYLDSDIDTDVYVDQAAGLDPVVGPNGERMCMKLDKAIYGTVQAARLFTKKFRAALVTIGFEVSLDDEAVYRLDHKLGRIVLATHVDDGIGGASTAAVRDWMYAEIIKHGFSFSQQGGWHTILGFGATRDLVNRTVTISAGGHIRDLVRTHLADEVASTLNPPTPTARTIMDLQPAGEETAAEASMHIAWRANARTLKGALIHIQQIHPAIAHGVSRACAHMATPTHESYAAAKRILAWLSHRADLGVTYGASHLRSATDLLPPTDALLPMGDVRDFSLFCTVDSDLPGKGLPVRAVDATTFIDKQSHRAQLGYTISLAGGCMEAVSRRQHSTAVDTAAAEMFAASVAGAVLVSVTSVLAFVSFGVLGQQTVRIWCDNEAAVLAANDASSIKRLAYIARRVRFLQELVTRKIVVLLNIDGKQNPADALTKHIEPKATFREYMARLYNTTASLFRFSHTTSMTHPAESSD